MKNKIINTCVCCLLSVTLVVPFGCSYSKQERTQENKLKVKIVKFTSDSLLYKDTVALSALVDSCKFIQLHCPKEYPIGFINEIIFWNSDIFILDQRIAKAVYKFTNDGQFIQVIGKLGKGPGEYLRPDDISVDAINKQLLIFSRQDRMLYFFDLETGSYLNEKKLDFAANEIQSLSDGHYVVFNHDIHNLNSTTLNNDFNVAYYNHDFTDIIYRDSPFIFKEGEGKSIYFTGRYFNIHDTLTYLNWRFNDTVYKVTPEGLDPILIFDFGQKKVKSANYEESTANYILKKIRNGDFSSLTNNVLIAKSNFITQYMNVENKQIDPEQQTFYLFGDLNSSSKPISSRFISDDLYHIGFAFPVSTFQDSFVSVFYPDELQEKFNQEAMDKISEKTGIELNNNFSPVLQLYKINYHGY